MGQRMPERLVSRRPGLSVRWKLTLSYAGAIIVAGALLLAIVWLFLLRYVPTLRPPDQPTFTPSRSDLVRAFVPPAAAALVFLLLFGLVGGWILAGRMLAPLSRITAATRAVSAGSLSHRIGLEGRQDEFRELADSFDSMIAKVEAQVAEQQRFAANASHELRTPLAITQTLLDVARNDSERDSRELIERLRSVNTRAIDLTEALLVLSRADQRSFVREQVDLSLLAEHSLETLLPLAEERGITIETVGSVASAIGSYPLLLQLTTNLLHNAIVHNLISGGTVKIVTAAEPDTASLSIENTGTRLTPQLVSTLAEPFQRGSERIRGDHGGVGLGLAIVTSITRAHGGTLTLVPLPTGGLRATVLLPRAASTPGG